MRLTAGLRREQGLKPAGRADVDRDLTALSEEFAAALMFGDDSEAPLSTVPAKSTGPLTDLDDVGFVHKLFSQGSIK